VKILVRIWFVANELISNAKKIIKQLEDIVSISNEPVAVDISLKNRINPLFERSDTIIKESQEAINRIANTETLYNDVNVIDISNRYRENDLITKSNNIATKANTVVNRLNEINVTNQVSGEIDVSQIYNNEEINSFTVTNNRRVAAINKIRESQAALAALLGGN
jgi:hypothetical protein